MYPLATCEAASGKRQGSGRGRGVEGGRGKKGLSRSFVVRSIKRYTYYVSKVFKGDNPLNVFKILKV
jgi:ribosomal protein L15